MAGDEMLRFYDFVLVILARNMDGCGRETKATDQANV